MNMKRIHIAHLLSPLMLYGKEKWLLALLNHIDREKFDSTVFLLTGAVDIELAPYLEDMGISSFRIDPGGRLSTKGIDEIADLMHRHEVDILHSHDYKADIYALFARRKRRVRILATPHGYNNEMDLKLRFYQWLDKRALSRFDCFAPLSHHLREHLGNLRDDRVSLIHNFVDTSNLPEHRAFDDRLISFIGRLTPLKRTEDVIRAIGLTTESDIKLQVIGDGAQRAYLETLAQSLGLEERVIFHGFRKDALDLLNGSALLVIPSTTEGISRVAMEAMAMGKPVIGTDIPGNRELIEDGRNGILVPKKDPQAIAGAIDRLVSDRELYDSLSNQAEHHIRTNHSAEIAAREYEKLYGKLMSET